MRMARTGKLATPRRLSLSALFARPFAHRGLHGGGGPENSLDAARAAQGAGWGIECDVRASRNGTPFVFHDRALPRLTGLKGAFTALDDVTIAQLHLLGTDNHVPSLAEFLACVGATPLLIEVKPPSGPVVRLCDAIAANLAGHAGPVGVMSFDPRVIACFRRRHPALLRGFVFSRRYRARSLTQSGLRLVMARTRPHFVACDIRDLPSQTSTLARRWEYPWRLGQCAPPRKSCARRLLPIRSFSRFERR